MPAPALGGGRSVLVRETIEAIVGKIGKETAKEGTEALAKGLEAQLARHGVAVLDAARQVGPSAVRLVEEAGEHGAVAARLLARHGEKAIGLIRSRRSLALIARHGDAAAEAILKHPGIAEPVIEALGQPGVKALNAVGTRGGRRLAQMVEDGSLSRMARTREVLVIVERFGDKAMNFVWKHKGSLTVASVLAAFLADPEPFLRGVRDITKSVAEHAVTPLAAAPTEVAREAVRQINWTLITLVVGGGCIAWWALRSASRSRARHREISAIEREAGCVVPSRVGIPKTHRDLLSNGERGNAAKEAAPRVATVGLP